MELWHSSGRSLPTLTGSSGHGQLKVGEHSSLRTSLRLQTTPIFTRAQFLGDWKWIKEAFVLQMSCTSREKRTTCFASKEGEHNYSDFRDSAKHRKRRRTHAQFMEQYDQRPLPNLCRVFGFHMNMIMSDFLHGFLMGTAQSAVGNTVGTLRAKRIWQHQG